MFFVISCIEIPNETRFAYNTYTYELIEYVILCIYSEKGKTGLFVTRNGCSVTFTELSKLFIYSQQKRFYTRGTLRSIRIS